MAEYVRHTADPIHLFTVILRNALADIAEAFSLLDMQVMAQQDVDAIDHVPFVIVGARNGQMLNGPGAWRWTIDTQIVARSMKEAADIADMVYVAMHESHDNNIRVPGVGGVSSVEDEEMPSRTSVSLTPAGDLTQYDGSFNVVIRKL